MFRKKNLRKIEEENLRKEAKNHSSLNFYFLIGFPPFYSLNIFNTTFQYINFVKTLKLDYHCINYISYFKK